MPLAALKHSLIAGFAGTVLMLALPAEALAGRQAYCNDYARDVANHEANPAGVVAGGVAGAITGAVLGGIIGGKSKSAGTGAIIGGVGGTALGAASTSSRWHRAYDNAYYDCMSRGGSEPATYADERPRPGTRAWYRYCTAKYRSFNPETGLYRTSSGRLKPCR
jgi:hypothetical protein